MAQRFYQTVSGVTPSVYQDLSGSWQRAFDMILPVRMRIAPIITADTNQGSYALGSTPDEINGNAGSIPNNINYPVLGIKLEADLDIAPTYTYEWVDAGQTSLKRTDADGNVSFVPATEGNRDYAEFLSSGATAAAYVPPEPPAPLSTEEKINRLLSDYDLTRAEMQAALAVKTTKAKK
jgi:hypothetical protein